MMMGNENMRWRLLIHSLDEKISSHSRMLSREEDEECCDKGDELCINPTNVICDVMTSCFISYVLYDLKGISYVLYDLKGISYVLYDVLYGVICDVISFKSYNTYDMKHLSGRCE